MSENAPIRLRHGPFDLAVDPTLGGSILFFDYMGPSGRTPLFRKAPPEARSPLDAASFPLVPYVNRIRGGTFRVGTREVCLRPNMAGDPSPLHGQGWLAPWTTIGADEVSAELLFQHEPDAWPWAYQARQSFDLDSAGLRMRLSCRNLSDQPMPCGLGFHPYFPCGPETVLDTGVEDVWTVDAQVLPLERIPAHGRYDLEDRRICGQQLDNGYSGWSGEAWIRDPTLPGAIRMRSREARFFQVYSPAEGGFFVAEPVSHANAALNEPESQWTDLGIVLLGPGEEMSLEARIDLVSGA